MTCYGRFAKGVLATAFPGVAAFAVLLAGCGGGMASAPANTNNPFMPEDAAVTLTITDAPPAGISVLSFEVTVSGAVLSPGNVSLISTPQQIEMKELETQSAFLSTATVPAGTYQSIAVNLTNPELTIMNQSGAAIGTCANNSVCRIEPAAAGNITFSGAPFPVTVASGGSTGFQFDINLSNLISNTLTLDFNAHGAVTVAQLPLPGENPNNLDDLDDLLGVVMNLDASSKKFVLHTTNGDFSVQADSNTEFELEDCTASDFSCLQNGFAVEVDALLMSGGAFIAKKVELEDNEADNEFYGVIYKIDDANTFEIVVLGELTSLQGIDLGNIIKVQLNHASFQVDSNGLTIPGSLQGAFENASDTSKLLPGQEVQIRERGTVFSGPLTALATDRVRLRVSQLTANVSGAPTPPNFNVANLPALFTSAGVNTIQVQSSSSTDFENVNGAGSLSDEDQVSLRGLLFATGANPSLIADKVRKR